MGGQAMSMFVDVSFSGTNLNNLVLQISKIDALKTSPSRVSYDDGPERPSEWWPEMVLKEFKRNFFVSWGDGAFSSKNRVSSSKDCIVKAHLKTIEFKTLSFKNVVESWDWEIISITNDKLFFYWEEKFNYDTPSFGDLHHNFTTGCAFKGNGHNRIPSRRFLEYGPWRTIRDEARDITFIQFHDLDVDEDTALKQAKIGHALLERNITGGLNGSIPIEELQNVHNIYEPQERSLMFVINDEKPNQRWYLEACAIKAYQTLDADKPVDRIKFMFPLEPEQSQPYLHDLWLYGLECWGMPGGVPTRLDDTYTPPPPAKPDWVQKLEEK
jgi:hypothetical protein